MAHATPFEVHVQKEDFKFNASHFVAFRGYRERIHGHNYKVGVRLIGERIQHDGYLLDFGDVKKAVRKLCKSWNEYFICPLLSDVIRIEEVDLSGVPHMQLTCEDNSLFVFPKSDCLCLPISHATTEEMSVYIWWKVRDMLKDNDVDLSKRGIRTMEITVQEAVGQESVFRCDVGYEGDVLKRYIPIGGEPGLFVKACREFCVHCVEQNL